MIKTDLKLMVHIIDVCSTRGAFKGEELAEVGLLRARLVNEINKEDKESNE